MSQPHGPTGFQCPHCGAWVNHEVLHTCATTPGFPRVWPPPGPWPPQPVVQPRQGWECPKCGGVYAPSMPLCIRCGPKATRTIDTAPDEGGNA